MTIEQPTWAKNKKEYDKKYLKEKMKCIGFTLSKERDENRIETWQSLGGKADFMRVILDAYANGELDHLNIEERIKNVD